MAKNNPRIPASNNPAAITPACVTPVESMPVLARFGLAEELEALGEGEAIGDTYVAKRKLVWFGETPESM